MNKVYRAHPLMLYKVIKPILFVLILPIIRGVIQYIVYGQAANILKIELLILGVMLLVGIMRLLTIRITITENEISFTKGFVFRKASKVALDNVSSAELVRNPLDYIFSTATLYINTEAGVVGRPDFEVRLKKRDALEIAEKLYNAELLSAAGFSVKRLSIAAALTSSALTGALVAVPIVDRAGRLFGIALSQMLFDEIDKTAQTFETYFPPIINTITLFLLLSYLISFIYTLIATLRFALFEGSRHIEVRYGLFVRRRILFDKDGINDICIEQTPLMRLFKRFSLRASVGGLKRQKGERAMLVPVAKRFELKRKEFGMEKFGADSESLRPERNPLILWRFLSIPLFLALIIIGTGLVLVFVLHYFDRFALFLMLVLLAADIYFAINCIFNYRRGKLQLGDNICARATVGVNTREMFCSKERIGIIKVCRNPTDVFGDTCRVRLTIRSEGSDSVKVRHLNHEAVKKEIKECFAVEY